MSEIVRRVGPDRACNGLIFHRRGAGFGGGRGAMAPRASAAAESVTQGRLGRLQLVKEIENGN